MEILTAAVIGGVIAAGTVNNNNAALEAIKKKKFVVEHILRKKNKGDKHMYDIVVGMMGKEVKVLTIMGVVPGVVTEVTDATVTLQHKHYKQIVNIDYIISITEKVLG